MIDRVQRTLELMAPELAGYRSREIFTEREIEKIIENRRRFEGRLQRPSKRVADFLEYARSETRLEKIRNRRIARLGTGLEETDLQLQRNVMRIYEGAMHSFDEPVVVKEFSEYCAKKKAGDRMKQALASKCLKRLRDTDLWVFCAQQLWQADDADGARCLFMKGVSVNGDARLHVEFFRFECLFAVRLDEVNRELGVDEEERDDIERGAIALAVLQSILEKFGDRHKAECLEIAQMSPDLHARASEMFSRIERR